MIIGDLDVDDFCVKRKVPLDLEVLFLEPIDIDEALTGKKYQKAAMIERATRQIVDLGCAVVRWSQIDHVIGMRTMRMLQEYFGQSLGVLEYDRIQTGKETEGRAIGINLPGQEGGRDWRDHYKKWLPEAHRPSTAWLDRIQNMQMRFHWDVGPLRESAALGKEVQRVSVYPHNRNRFPGWAFNLDASSHQQLRAAIQFLVLVEKGLGIEEGSLSNDLYNGNSVAGPTGLDLDGIPEGTVIATGHWDLGRLTVHFPSGMPGLICWTKYGRPFRPQIPPGCLFVQAGMELDMLTGGHVTAGHHEVVVLPETREIVQREKTAGHSTVRVGMPLFAEGRDQEMLPVPPYHLDDGAVLACVPYRTCADWQRAETRRIGI